MLFSQQVFLLVMQGAEELPAGPTVQVIAFIPLWTEMFQRWAEAPHSIPAASEHKLGSEGIMHFMLAELSRPACPAHSFPAGKPLAGLRPPQHS